MHWVKVRANAEREAYADVEKAARIEFYRDNEGHELAVIHAVGSGERLVEVATVDDPKVLEQLRGMDGIRTGPNWEPVALSGPPRST